MRLGERPATTNNKWQDTWDKDKELNGFYTADFEVYGVNSNDSRNSQVEIYIATE
ncbi:MAG: hypothetical protein ACR2KZ_21225 [Segetibacter sp.]